MFEPAIGRMIEADGQHIAITGAGGWLGLATLDLLRQALGTAFATRVSCYGSSRRTLSLGDGASIEQAPLEALAGLKADRIWLLHLAFLTKDRAEAMSEEAYRRANEAISETVLAAMDRLPVEAVFLASSGAAAKAHDPAAAPAMRLYGAMKLADEDRFAAWAERTQRRAVIGRIFNITGPHINKHQAYAIASFILDGLAGRTITVRAPREVYRGYVAIRELMSLVFALLADTGRTVTRFDSGGAALELGAVAAAVGQALGGGIAVERAAITDPAADRYVGDGRSYAGLLAEHGVTPVDLGSQIFELLDYFRKAAV